VEDDVDVWCYAIVSCMPEMTITNCSIELTMNLAAINSSAKSQQYIAAFYHPIDGVGSARCRGSSYFIVHHIVSYLSVE